MVKLIVKYEKGVRVGFKVLEGSISDEEEEQIEMELSKRDSHIKVNKVTLKGGY